MKQVLGGLVLLMGLGLASWIGYNLLIQRLPAAQGRSPVMPILVSAAFIYVGIKWMRGDSAG